MFENNYKNAMDGIKPSDEAIEKTKNAMNAQRKNKHSVNNTIRIVSIACLLFALICTSVFAGFKISDAFNNYETIGHENISNSGEIFTPPVLLDLKPAKSYTQVIELIKENSKSVDITLEGDLVIDDFLQEEIQEETQESPTTPPFSDEGSIGGDRAPVHSDTNNQVSGVQEGDIVKNDGRYIYYCSVIDKKVYITEVKNDKMVQVASILMEYDAKELFLIGDRLAIISQSYTDKDGKYKNYVSCMYYDISDRSNPKKLDSFTQEGLYSSARAVDGKIYVISTKYSYYEDEAYIIPEINGIPIDYDNILIPADCKNNVFTIITAFDAEGGKAISDLAIIGDGRTIYSAKENIYIASYVVNDNDLDDIVPDRSTKIYRIALNNGNLTATGAGCIPGSVNNQFWMDEKDGRLRVAAVIQPVRTKEDTEYGYTYREFLDSYNKVYCLGDELEIIGESEKLGVTETIKSVRYIGNIAYVVTFRQTDPLYAIDLSDATNPKTLSELKIDGFSTYMHGYGSNYLLGIGYDATSSGVTNGIKLTMFDISNNADIYDISTYSYKWDENSWGYSDALNNHKAVLIDVKKEIIAIPMGMQEVIKDEYGNYEYIEETVFVFFAFDGNTITERGKVKISDPKYYWFENLRGLYIGDYGYVVSDSGIICISLNTLEIVSEMDFN